MSNTNETTVPMAKEKMNKMSAAGYAVGFSGVNVCWYMINNYLMLFYTDVVGLAATAISAIMLIARIWDAINDPMMGAIVDRTNTRWGKFKPYIVIAPPFLALFNVLTFTAWPMKGITKAVVCLICYIGVGMVYTVLQVAINGLVNRLSNDSQIKMDIISIAQVGSSIVQTILGACAMPLILYFSKSEVANGRGYFWGTLVFSLISIPMFWFCAWTCKEVKNKKEDTTETIKPVKKAEKQPLSKSIKALIKNKMLLISIFSTFIGAVGAIARMSMLTYYLIYVAGAYAVIAPTFTIISLMQMLGNLCLPFLTRKFGKITTFKLLLGGNAVTMLILFFAPKGSVVILLVLSAIYGFTNAGASICYGMTCDSIDYGEYEFGVRDDALAFSFMSLAVKCATAVTGSVGVLALAAVGYVAGAEQSAHTITGINVIVNLIPAILVIISVMIMFFYKLDEKRMEEIHAELAVRRQAE